MTSYTYLLSAARFAVAVGADPKWVRNAAAVLGRPIRYTVAEGQRLGLVRELHAGFGMPLKAAEGLAETALSAGGDGSREMSVKANADSSAELRIDIERYRSTFTARLSRARTLGTGKQRGRPRKWARGSIAAAEEHGLDVGLLMSSLSLTPAERLRRLDQNAAFLAAVRRVEPTGRA